MSILPKKAHGRKEQHFYKLYFFLPIGWGKEELEGVKGQWMLVTYSAGIELLPFETMVSSRDQLIKGGYRTQVYAHRTVETVEFMPDETVESAIEHTEKINAEDSTS